MIDTFGRDPSPRDCAAVACPFLLLGTFFVVAGLADPAGDVPVPSDGVVITGGLPTPPVLVYVDFASVGASCLESIVKPSPYLCRTFACGAYLPDVALGLDACRTVPLSCARVLPGC